MTAAPPTRRRALAALGAAALMLSGCGSPDIPPDERQGHGQMTTVLTLSGLNFNTIDRMGKALQGFAEGPGRVRQPVSYPAAATAQSIPTGVTALDAAIRSTTGDIIVLAHSQGAQVAGRWLREFAGRSDAPPPDRLQFILLGNPERRLGGHPGSRGLDGQPLQATPDDTRYRVLDITRRWDGWANTDNWPDGDDGVAARTRLILGRAVDHLGYDKVSLADPAMQTRAKVGNTTYLVAP